MNIVKREAVRPMRHGQPAETKKATRRSLFLCFKAFSDLEADMAQRTGLEPATPGVTGRYSNRLNYRCVSLRLAPD